MKNIYWLIVLAALVLSSCSLDQKTNRFEQLFVNYKIAGNYTVNGNISAQAFIQEIDLNTSASLCTRPQVAYLKLALLNKPIAFRVSKHCFPYTKQTGRIELLRRSSDSLRLELSYIPPNTLERAIKEILKNRFSGANAIVIQPAFGWRTSSHASILSDMERTFEAILSYADEVCLDWYGNKLAELKEADFLEFQGRFKIAPVIDDLTPDLPSRQYM